MNTNNNLVLSVNELSHVVMYCPITCVFDLLFVNKKFKKAIQEAPRNPHRTTVLCKKEVKLFCKTDMLKGGMNELIHTLSDKKWKKRTLRYASFDVGFNTWHDYNKNKFYHLIAKDVVSLTLSTSDIDTLLMILKETTKLKKLETSLQMLNKINEIYPIEHLFDHFKLEKLILTGVDLDGPMMSTFYSYLEYCKNIRIILKCSSFNLKAIQQLSTQPNVVCCLYSLKESESQVLPFVLKRSVVLFTPLSLQFNKYDHFAAIKKSYLPFVSSEEPFDASRLVLKGSFKPNVNLMESLQYFFFEETSKLKKAKVIDLSTLNLVGLTLVGHKSKRKITLPTTLKELKVVDFCDVDSFISPIGTSGLRAFTTITRLEVDGIEGIVNPPHSVMEFTASNCSIGKIQTKDMKMLYSLILNKVKLEGLVVFEKLDQIVFNSVTGVRPIDYKNDCYSFVTKDGKE